MPIISEEFNEYAVQYYTDYFLHAIIRCFKDSVFKGRLYFYKDGTTLPPSEIISNNIQLNFSEQSFSEIMDLLRNEKPLFIHLNDRTNIGWLATNREQVGEEES